MASRTVLIWACAAALIAACLIEALRSPLLQWRDPIYILGGFAGIVGLTLLLIQPLLIGLERPSMRVRRIHMWVGCLLVFSVIIHVSGLWITSPPDVVDVLLFRSPTPFGIWGVVAMWAVFAAAVMAVFRRKIRPRIWRIFHRAATTLVVIGTVVHTWLIQGAMGDISKALICLMILAAMALALWQRSARARA